MEELLQSGNFCVYDFYPRIHARYVTAAELAPLDPDGRALLNVNTPEELARILGEFPS
jgi:molybdopterin-guanine dinucleotide biosynthesis protein A